MRKEIEFKDMVIFWIVYSTVRLALAWISGDLAQGLVSVFVAIASTATVYFLFGTLIE